MKKQLSEKERSELLPHIIKVLTSGVRWEDKELHYPAGAIIAAVESLPDVEKDDSNEHLNKGFDTNGWQWDWWQNFRHGGKIFVLSGSGFYGGHAFGPADE